jgi:hypothetical protein
VHKTQPGTPVLVVAATTVLILANPAQTQTSRPSTSPPATGRHALLESSLSRTLGDYDAEPRRADGRVDIDKLLEQIRAAHLNTYDWLIWHAATDWDDLRAFLPWAAKNRIRVWVTLCPPTEQGGTYPYSEPFRLDFVRWAEEIGRLSVEHSNLSALVIDDFCSNLSLFKPEYVNRISQTLRRNNPRVAFLPTIYYWTVAGVDAAAYFKSGSQRVAPGKPMPELRKLLESYGDAIDGIVFPYAELESGDALAYQLDVCRKWLGPERFLITCLYAQGSSGSGGNKPRTPDYLRKTLQIAHEKSDGIRIYCLPKEKLNEDPRFAAVAKRYSLWSSASQPE